MKTGSTHKIGLLFLMVAMTILALLVFEMNFGVQKEIEEEGFMIINLAIAMFIALCFAAVFFLCNISAGIADFMKAVVLVEKKMGTGKDGGVL